MNTLNRLLFGLALAVASFAAQAHKASDAYLQLTVPERGSSEDTAIALRVDVALRDLDVALDLDADADGRLTWSEVQAAWPAIERFVLAGVQLGGCEWQGADRALERRSDGAYAVLRLRSHCSAALDAAIRYTLFAEIDPTHRGILRIARPGSAPLVQVLDPTMPVAFDPASRAAPATPGNFVAEGIRHIVTGYDHVLFLLCLLLPAVMRRTASSNGERPRWVPQDRLGTALWPVLGIVTAFTIAHSITLTVAAMQWVSLPARLIEPAIALTIVIAALDNLVPIFRRWRVLITFLFGLVHGFGFANVLGELDLPAADFAWALLQFNLGLELGQIAIVLLATALFHLLRRHRAYPRWVIQGGSAAAIGIGVLWFIERTADVSLLPF